MAFRNRLAACAVVLLALILLTISAIAGTEGAAAARYVVAQCGWHVGHDADWSDFSGGRFSRSSYCQTPASADAFDGVHLSSQVKGSVDRVGGTKTANWRWQAPAGTSIVTVRGQRWQVVRDGFQHRLGVVPPNGEFTSFLSADTTDTTRREFSKGFSPWAQAFVSRLVCFRNADKSCSAGGAVQSGIRALTITLDDPSKPTSQISGSLVTGGWLRGTQSLSFSNKDIGSGLRFAETAIAGSVRARNEMTCGKVSITGQWRGTKMQPCPTTATGTQSVDTKTLPDGAHLLKHCGIDFAGASGCAEERTIRVDNNPPASPRGLKVFDGDGWHRRNSFDLSWTNPGQGSGSPIVSSVFRIAGSDGYATGPSIRKEFEKISGIELPGSGEYRVQVWLTDQAGNADSGHAAEATLRLDEVPPTGYFLDPPEDDPELIRVPVADRFSGVAGGSISLRPAADERWEEIPAVLKGQEEPMLVARFPSGKRPGTWLLKAEIEDKAGNKTVTDRRANGSLISVKTPLKEQTSLTVGFNEKAKAGGRSVEVGFGKKAWLAGRLVGSESGGVRGAEITVTERPYAGSRLGVTVRTITTDARGNFNLWLKAGAGRQVTASFAGNRKLESAGSGPLEMRVRGAVKFKAVPRKVRTGRKVFFRGQVRSQAAWHPLRGNVIQVQYFEKSSGRWRPVVVTRTDRRGHFRTGYRFRYITGVARIKLRALLVPASRFPYVGAASIAVTIRVRG